jgi:uncharacterized membrane protein YtjA (UPF0391 family)
MMPLSAPGATDHRPLDTQTHQQRCKEAVMLGWAAIFFILAVISAALGFSGLAGAASWMAQVLFLVFLILLVASVVSRGRLP